ncbi:MAG: hypothetical protein LBL66_01085 [Clostridiales bacterium]|nr:hypothetical protein [Clostridiales bacterium]
MHNCGQEKNARGVPVFGRDCRVAQCTVYSPQCTVHSFGRGTLRAGRSPVR